MLLRNILTRRANQGHYSIIAPFVEPSLGLPDKGLFGAIAGKIRTIEVAPARARSITQFTLPKSLRTSSCRK
jgi:hypothetical protein